METGNAPASAESASSNSPSVSVSVSVALSSSGETWAVEKGRDGVERDEGALRRLCDYYASRGIELVRHPVVHAARSVDEDVDGDVLLFDEDGRIQRWNEATHEIQPITASAVAPETVAVHTGSKGSKGGAEIRVGSFRPPG